MMIHLFHKVERNLSRVSTVVQIHRAARRFPLLNVTCSSPAGLDKGEFLLARAACPSCMMDLHERGNAALPSICIVLNLLDIVTFRMKMHFVEHLAISGKGEERGARRRTTTC
jgi:hypothetical protein